MAHALMTLSEENQFVFVCPIFDAKVKMASCMFLREQVWMGKPVEKRPGCQVAMKCGKCPAAAIVDAISYKRWPEGDRDRYGADEPILGKLRADILERVYRPLIRNDILNQFSVSPGERDMLMSANERIEKQLGAAPKDRGHVYHAPKTRTAQSAPKTTASNSAVQEAARTGNMAAAINAA